MRFWYRFIILLVGIVILFESAYLYFLSSGRPPVSENKVGSHDVKPSDRVSENPSSTTDRRWAFLFQVQIIAILNFFNQIIQFAVLYIRNLYKLFHNQPLYNIYKYTLMVYYIIIHRLSKQTMKGRLLIKVLAGLFGPPPSNPSI